jgi:hypothetical protein
LFRGLVGSEMCIRDRPRCVVPSIAILEFIKIAVEANKQMILVVIQ